jgi:MFS family permease
MSCTTAVSAGPVARASKLSRSAAFYLLASITISFLAGSAAPTPLYPIYQAEWGFSPITVTIVFGVYAVAVLAALLVAGGLSDYVGRRPVLLAAVVVQAITMLLFASATGLVGLLVARIVQGLSTGAAVAAVGAGLIDLDKLRGTSANAISPPLGTAVGALLAGFTVQFLPAPTQLVYLVLFVVFVVQAIGVFLMPETIAPKAGALRSLKPTLRVPAAARRPLLLAVPALIATWALAGFYASLGPTLVRSVLGFQSALPGGLTLFVLAGSAAVAVLLLKDGDPRRMMLIGVSALYVGVGIALTALVHHSPLVFFLGTAVTGMGFGAGFQGAVRNVVPHAQAHERAGVLSVIFVISYLAMGLPAIVAGYMVVYDGGILSAARDFGAIVMVLAALAFAGTVGPVRARAQ